MEIPIEALALVDAASKDPTRYQLCGVQFERNGHLRAVATDGRQLTRLSWRDASAPKDKHSVVIATDCLRRIKKLATKNARTLSLAENNNFRREMTILPGTDFLAVEPVNGKFPDVEFVFKNAMDDTVYPQSVLFDPFIMMSQLKVICGALGITRTRPGQIEMRVPTKKSSHEAILFYGESGDLKVEGGVMPITKNDKKK